MRNRHVRDIHNFGMCDHSAENFYRGPQFRWHLEYSHAATDGEWSEKLQNKCMMDERELIQVLRGL